MIILISGASCTGKTLLSKRILEEHGITSYSIDHIKMGLYRGTEKCGFTPMDSDEHIGTVLWPILKGIIMTAIENGQDLIIEGAYIFPQYLEDFTDTYMKHILPVFICFSESYVKSNYADGLIKYRHVVEKRSYVEDRSAEVFIQDHLQLMQKCEAYGCDYFKIEKDYEVEIDEVYAFISTWIKSHKQSAKHDL